MGSYSALVFHFVRYPSKSGDFSTALTFIHKATAVTLSLDCHD